MRSQLFAVDELHHALPLEYCKRATATLSSNSRKLLAEDITRILKEEKKKKKRRKRDAVNISLLFGAGKKNHAWKIRQRPSEQSSSWLPGYYSVQGQ